MSETILAIDPGNAQSAYVLYNGRVLRHEIVDNEVMRSIIFGIGLEANHLACEGIACYGMPVGKETFDTCIWIGRFIECWNRPWTLVYRQAVKLHLCGNVRAKDPNIRQALIDLHGGSNAIGKKKSPGPLYKIASHEWSALAIAVTFLAATQKEKASCN